MHNVTICANFKEEPSEDMKWHTEDKLSSLIRAIIPDAELQIASGKGSWWITISAITGGAGAWLLLELASWALAKGMDKLIEEKKSVPGTQPQDIVTIDAQSIVQPFDDIHQAVALGKFSKDLTSYLGATRIVLGEWRDDSNEGIAVMYHTTENDNVVSFYRTQSSETFKEMYHKLATDE